DGEGVRIQAALLARADDAPDQQRQRPRVVPIRGDAVQRVLRSVGSVDQQLRPNTAGCADELHLRGSDGRERVLRPRVHEIESKSSPRATYIARGDLIFELPA